MANVKFVLNRNGVKELMQSPEMMEICKGYADHALSALGSGYEVSTFTGKNRVNAQITAESMSARRENSNNNTILKALRG